jgi:hypothetical protein
MKDQKIPYDNNGVFDGDSFYELEYNAWISTCGTFNVIKLRSWNMNFLKERLNKYGEKSRSKILYKQHSKHLLELHYLGKNWKG